MEKKNRPVKVKKTMRRPRKKNIPSVYDNIDSTSSSNRPDDENRVMNNSSNNIRRENPNTMSKEEGMSKQRQINNNNNIDNPYNIDSLDNDNNLNDINDINNIENDFSDNKKDKNGKNTANMKKSGKRIFGIPISPKVAIPVGIVIALLIAGIVAFAILLSAVDKKNGVDKNVYIEEGSSLYTISQELKSNDLIRNEIAFKLYVKGTFKSSKLKAGYYTFSQKESAIKIVKKLLKGGTNKTTALVIKEGLDLNRISSAVEKAGICKKQAFLDEIKNNGDYYRKKYDFLSSVPKNREYILEGYLFADTYEVYVKSSPRDLIEKMLDRFDQAYTAEYKARTKEMGKSIDEIVTMASVVERETILDKELPVVAGVFYNRLDKGMKLESCATLQYIYKDYQFSFTESQKNVDSKYNTYKYEGLPAGPIANFRQEALKAALYPKKTDYIFFCTKNDGTGESAFAKTLAGHEKNIKKYSSNWK